MKNKIQNSHIKKNIKKILFAVMDIYIYIYIYKHIYKYLLMIGLLNHLKHTQVTMLFISLIVWLEKVNIAVT